MKIPIKRQAPNGADLSQDGAFAKYLAHLKKLPSPKRERIAEMLRLWASCIAPSTNAATDAVKQALN